MGQILSVDHFIPQLTADGSFTFFSLEFSESFHSQFGAKEEAQKKFVIPCQLAEKAANNSQLKLLDICYGLGYNSAAALSTIWSINPHCRVELVALELDEAVPKSAIAYNLLAEWGTLIAELLSDLTINKFLKTNHLIAHLYLGDARENIQKLSSVNFQADAIFLDPFSPPKCPQLWTVEFLGLVAKCLREDGRLATYSCAASVRTALSLAGLQIGASSSVGRRSPGTIARRINDNLPMLSQQEQEHLQTRAAIPYRDPNLSDSAPVIRQRRQQEQAISNLEPSSHWKKRWI
jgi:tRNA U34 5-methylaminomethyl-2-thiouridine-forming methyltransferase MnmC